MALEIQMTFGLCRWPASNSMCRLLKYVFSQLVRPPGILADTCLGNQTGQVVGDGFIRPRIYISYSLSFFFWKLLPANVPLDIMNLTVFLQLRGNPRSLSKSST
jgi:hypothetical protein